MTNITEVPNWQSFQKARVLVFNRFQVNIQGTTGKANDTEFTYLLYTDKKLNKTQLSTIQTYINGIVDTLRSF